MSTSKPVHVPAWEQTLRNRDAVRAARQSAVLARQHVSMFAVVLGAIVSAALSVSHWLA